MNQLPIRTKKDGIEQRTYCVDDIIKMLGISRSAAYHLVRAGHFKTIRIGASIRILKDSFEEWLNNGVTND